MKHTKRNILMAIEPFKRAVALARLGIGTREIARRTKLTECQITYRKGVYKQEMKFEHGLSTLWRNGENPILDEMLNDATKVMEYEFEREFLPQIVIPELKFSKIKEPKAPTVKEAARILKRERQAA